MGGFSFCLAAEEGTTNPPEDPENTDRNEERPDYPENIENHVEPKGERCVEERLQR